MPVYYMFLIIRFALSSALVTPTHQLKEKLLNPSYDPDSRSTVGDNYLTQVTVVPNKFLLLSMDQQQETIRFTEEFILTWKDPLLTWDPNTSDHNSNWIKLLEKDIWIPDVIFQSAISKEELISEDERMIDLKYDGTLRQLNPKVFDYPCALSLDQFPYDAQICDVQIGPWMYFDTQVVVNSFVDRIEPVPNRFEGNSEWDLIDIVATSETFKFPFSIGNFSYINYRVTLKRKPVYYVLVIQAPTFIVTTLTLFGLFTPVSQTRRRHEKVTLGLNLFVSISILLNLVSDMMPKASRLPLLGNYILAEIFVCGIGVIVSIATLSAHQKCHTRLIRPPRWVLRFVLLDCSSKVGNSSKYISTIRLATKSNGMPITKMNSRIVNVCSLVRYEVEHKKKSVAIEQIWNQVFDRIDMFCLILFQVLNITASVIFMR